MNQTATTDAPRKISDRIRALLPDYLAKRSFDIIRIDACLKEGAFDEIASIGHKMSGSGSGYGFPELSHLGYDLEEAADQRDATAVANHSEALRRLMEQINAEGFKPANAGNAASQ
jgi:HPt (histidine-containing phosphotransfer) domain-containing protein